MRAPGEGRTVRVHRPARNVPTAEPRITTPSMAARPTETSIANPAVTRLDSSIGRRPRWGDMVFRGLSAACAASILLLLLALAIFMVKGSLPAFAAHGWRFVIDRMWDPTGNRYGALAFIYGTVYTSLIALAISLPLGIMTAVFLVEIGPRVLKGPIS